MKNYKLAKVSFMGDSIVDNWFTPIYSYFGAFAEATGIKRDGDSLQSNGVSGSTISSLSNQFTGRVAALNNGANLVIIWGGTNDWGGNVALGASNSANEAEFNGGLNSLIAALNTKYPNSNILFLTPLQRNLHGAESLTNGLGLTLRAYCDAIIAKCIEHSLNVIDLNAISGINRSNVASFTSDGLHPNTSGYDRIGSVLGSQVNIMPVNAPFSTFVGF